MMWHKKSNQLLTSNNQPNNLTIPNTNPVGGGIRGNKRLTHTNQLTLLTTLKHLSILSITTSLLLVLTINIYRTYSYTNTLTNAVENTNQTQPSNSTSATCNPSNTNAPVCIALSIKSSSSATGDSSLTMAIPEQGGIVTGSHTIDITTNSYNGWSLYMEVTDPGNQSSTGDANTNKDANLINTTQQSSTTNPYTIASLPEEAMPYRGDTTTLSNNTWGIAMPYGAYSDGFSPVTTDNNPYKADPTTSEGQQTLSTTLWASPKYMSDKHVILAARDGYSPSTVHPETRTIYYGVRVDNPSATPAGDYQASIVYTAIANLPPSPTITTITPNTYTIGSNDSTTITITGTNLASTYEVWIDLDKDTNTSTNQNINPDPNEVCTNIQIVSDTKLTCTIPTPSSTLTINPDTYNLYLRTQANDLATATFTYTTPPPSISSTVETVTDEGTTIIDNIVIDYDENLIPVIYEGYDGNGGGYWRVVTNQELKDNPKTWFNYSNTEKRWANAITVTKDSREDYRAKQNIEVNGTPTPEQLQELTINTNNNPTILGYWVYIPRYAYEVMRPNAVDRVVAPQNFNIRFETAEDTKKTPASSCNLGINTDPNKYPMWGTKPSGYNSTNEGNAGPDSANVLAKDYRTRCNIPRTYNDTTIDQVKEDNTTTWATHPAFSWGTKETGYTELNGIWVGKFETTGTSTNPTIKPNQHANIYKRIGDSYTMAKHIGIYDENNTGGNNVAGSDTVLYARGEWTSLHNLKTTTSHMLKNSEWGAVAYLASSIYGAGTNNVSINSAFTTTSADADGTSSKYGITGCGPKDIDRSTDTYNSVTTSTGEALLPALSSSHIEDPLACGDTAHSYIGNIGVLASTTNNVYGIYDMSGGVYERVVGNLSDSPNKSSTTSYFRNPTKPPYVDIYLSMDFSNKPDWSVASSDSEDLYNNDICTWDNCGGHALHETKLYQSVSSRDQSWGGDDPGFANSYNPWFLRGGGAGSGSDAGLFTSSSNNGIANINTGFRAVLSP